MSLTPDELRRRADDADCNRMPACGVYGDGLIVTDARTFRDLADELERIPALEKQLEDFERMTLKNRQDDYSEYHKTLAAMREAVRVAGEALDITYYRVWHDSTCQKSEIEGDPCDCGHEQVLTVAKEALAKIRALPLLSNEREDANDCAFCIHQKEIDGCVAKITELESEIARKDEALHQILNESTICGSDFGNFRVAALAEAALRPKAPRIVQGGDCWQVATPTCQVLVRNFEPPACSAPVIPGTDRCERHQRA